MNNRENLFIIILNWNGWEKDTKECLRSISLQSNRKYHIILVDNCSEIAEVNAIHSYCQENYANYNTYSDEEIISGKIDFETCFCKKEHLSELSLTLIRNSDNRGFAGGNNVALKYLFQNGAIFTMLLNNDTVLDKDALRKLYEFSISHPEFAAITPQIRYFTPPDKIWNCGGSISWYGARKYYYAMENISRVPQTGYKFVDYATGCALLLRLQDTGPLSDKYFFGEEDFELSLRLKKQNKKEVCFFESIIYHKVGASHKKINENNEGKMVMFYAVRLSNLKDYYSFPRWIISFLVYYLYSFYNICFRNKLPISSFFKMWKEINFLLNSRKVFDKELFFATIKNR